MTSQVQVGLVETGEGDVDCLPRPFRTTSRQLLGTWSAIDGITDSVTMSLLSLYSSFSQNELNCLNVAAEQKPDHVGT